MGWFDVHAHLTHPRMVADEAEVLARAAAAGVSTIVSNGLNPADNEAVAALARRSSLVKPAFGLYPVDAVLQEMVALGVDYPREEEGTTPGDDAVQWVREHAHEAFAIGEIGLDHYWVPEALWGLQEQHFRALVRVAMEADKPVILHSRKAERRTFEVLQELGARRVNWHCYSSKVKLAQQIAAEGHYLSIPANARKAENFQRMLQVLPRDRVLLETDCPYLGPESGVRNEPANVQHTAAFAAELWGCELEAVQEQLSRNFEALFGVRP